MEDANILFAYLGISAAVKLFGTIWTHGQKPNNLECVGQVSRVTLFPVKSMKGIELDNGICTKIGLQHPTHEIIDRSVLVVRNGQFVASKMIPKMVKIHTEPDGKRRVRLKGDGVTPLTVSLDRDPSLEVITAKCSYRHGIVITCCRVLGEKVEGQDCGEEAAEWISDYLETPGLRLIVGADGLQRRKLPQRGDKWTASTKPEDQVMYNNAFPYLLASEQGLRDFNQRLGEEFPMDRFRPNIVVSGCAPFDEDSWDEIWIGDLKFANRKPCQRCPCTTVDPVEGVIHAKNEPLNTLGKYRNVCRDYPKRPIYGALLVLESKEGPIKIGDAVYVKRKITEGSLW